MTVPRAPQRRIVGTCRHFAVLSCALLRHRGIASRVRCGFATYFQPGQGLDHWVTEYRDRDGGRWVRIDSEVLGSTLVTCPADLRPGEFLTGGEAWTAFRQGEIDDSRFGVYGTGNWGAAEIRGNAVRDLAALNKVETLPWDEWGRITEAYQGRTGPGYDELLDTPGRCMRRGRPHDPGVALPARRTAGARRPDRLTRSWLAPQPETLLEPMTVVAGHDSSASCSSATEQVRPRAPPPVTSTEHANQPQHDPI